MVRAGNTRGKVSPVLLVSALSITVVTSIGVLRYVSADEPTNATMPSAKTEGASILDTSSTSSAPVDAVAAANLSAQDTHADSSSQQQAGVNEGSVTVNGKTYIVAGNGELHTTTHDANGQASIDISVKSSGNGQGSSTSSNVHVNSQSTNVSQSTHGKNP